MTTSPTDSESQRKLRIVRAAEALFAVHPYDAVSIRDIAYKAGVNSALVGYHFGSKEQLYHALFERRYHAITSDRVNRLRKLQLRPASLQSLRSVVAAWTGPLLCSIDDEDNRDFIRLLAREASDGAQDRRSIFASYLDPSARECVAALHQVLPTADPADVALGYLWMVSTLIAAINGTERISRLMQAGDRPKGADPAKAESGPIQPSALGQQLEIFVTAGLWALLSTVPADSPGSRVQGL